jgi:hypothetical protein
MYMGLMMLSRQNYARQSEGVKLSDLKSEMAIENLKKKHITR